MSLVETTSEERAALRAEIEGWQSKYGEAFDEPERAGLDDKVWLPNKK